MEEKNEVVNKGGVVSGDAAIGLAVLYVVGKIVYHGAVLGGTYYFSNRVDEFLKARHAKKVAKKEKA